MDRCIGDAAAHTAGKAGAAGTRGLEEDCLPCGTTAPLIAVNNAGAAAGSELRNIVVPVADERAKGRGGGQGRGVTHMHMVPFPPEKQPTAPWLFWSGENLSVPDHVYPCAHPKSRLPPILYTPE